jgi:hypothetical protein
MQPLAAEPIAYGKLRETKIANALISDAEMSFGAKFFVGAVGLAITEPIIDAFKAAMGGLWVGGTVTLFDSLISFAPNAMNRVFHGNDCSVALPLAAVLEIRVRFGFLTKIIDLVTAHGTLSIRCFGAEGFAARIREAKSDLCGSNFGGK